MVLTQEVYYLNLIARCDLKDKFVLKSYQNNNFMYFLKGISCCEYLLPYILKRSIFLCNNENIRPLAKVKKQSDVSIDFIKFINSKIIENGTYARGLLFFLVI